MNSWLMFSWNPHSPCGPGRGKVRGVLCDNYLRCNFYMFCLKFSWNRLSPSATSSGPDRERGRGSNMTQMSEVTVTFPSAVHPTPSAMECIISYTKYALVCLRIAQICAQHIVLVWIWHWLFLLSLTQWKQPVKSVFTIWKDKCIA